MSGKYSGVQFDLHNCINYIELDESILGIKGVVKNETVLKGVYTTSVYKKSKTKKESSVNHNSFYNQISLVVAPGRNVKLFANGSIHVTGLRDPDELPKLMSDLYKKLSSVTGETNVKVFTDNGITRDIDDNIYGESGVIGYKMENGLFCINGSTYTLDAHTGFFVSAKGLRKKKLCNQHGQPVGYLVIKLLKNKSKLYKKNSCIVFDKNVYTDEAFDYSLIYHMGKETSVIGKRVYEINPVPERLPGVYKKDLVKGVLTGTTCKVNCINIYFTLERPISRKRLFEFLSSHGYTVEFKPEKYSGVKLIYKINPLSNGPHECALNCVCDNVTFLIFQSGNVIASGFNNVHSIEKVVADVTGLFTQNPQMWLQN